MQNDRTCTVSETIISPVIVSGVSQNKVQIKLRVHFEIYVLVLRYIRQLLTVTTQVWLHISNFSWKVRQPNSTYTMLRSRYTFIHVLWSACTDVRIWPIFDSNTCVLCPSGKWIIHVRRLFTEQDIPNILCDKVVLWKIIYCTYLSISACD